ncbi:hypothetical protein JMJ35_002399 [Cladonia borealis]|uniref:Protein kinase domain-containing protein n=1 Tax=Cladonia borealis TaxID=184061 RepID=A0AA39R557_9LECA|nr:hypothetical protein JMJ35_002399 [Cladonia borealis]
MSQHIMDVFQTTAKTLQLLYGFFKPFFKHKKDSESLSIRLQWDLRVLDKLQNTLIALQQSGVSADDADQILWNDSVKYLEDLTGRLQGIQYNIKNKSNMLTWWSDEQDYRELERELREWTQRFDVHLLALPYSMRSNIDLTSLDANLATPFLAAQSRIEGFRRDSQAAKAESMRQMLIEDHADQFSEQRAPGKHTFVKFKGKDVIVEYKKIPTRFLEQERSKVSEVFNNSIAEICAILNHCDPPSTGVLKSLGFFHVLDGENPRCGIVYAIPTTLMQGDSIPRTLSSILTEPAGHTLEQRFELARKLATAVFFLHSVGWVHKAIRSSNVIVLQSSQIPETRRYPISLGDPYLVNLESARGVQEHSDPSDRLKRALFEQDIYDHPYRVSEGQNVDLKYSMVHDVYSLGVVLLEIGFWNPMTLYQSRFIVDREQGDIAGVRMKTPIERREVLLKLARTSAIYMGRKYATIVENCLNLEGSQHGHVGFIKDVLGQLERLSAAMN